MSHSHKGIVSQATINLIERLREQAIFFASNLRMALPAVIAERKRLESNPAEAIDQLRLNFLKREQEAALLASVRLDTYQLELLQRPPLCAYCWMLDGKRMTLKPGLTEAEVLGCEVCGSEYKT